jgi:hypothetical protein
VRSVKFSILFVLTVIAYKGYGQDTYGEIRFLLKITHSREIYIKNAKDKIEEFKKTDTIIPDEYWNQFIKELESSYTELDSALVMIYAKHFTQQEIQGLIQFYQTKLGQKSLAMAPIIAVESNEAGNIIGLRISEKILNRMVNHETDTVQKKVVKRKHTRHFFRSPEWYKKYQDRRRFKKGRF